MSSGVESRKEAHLISIKWKEISFGTIEGDTARIAFPRRPREINKSNRFPLAKRVANSEVLSRLCVGAQNAPIIAQESFLVRPLSRVSIKHVSLAVLTSSSHMFDHL